MGAGWFEREHRAFGFPFPPIRERLDILTEQVEIVHRLWGGEGAQVDFEGEHYRLEACPALPTPYQDPHPPLIIGGDAGPRSVALAARWADEYDFVYVNPADARERGQRVSAACEAIGRDPGEVRRSLLTKTVVGVDEADVRRRAAEQMAWQGRGRRRRRVPRRPPGQPRRRDRRIEVLERLAAFAAAGIQRVLRPSVGAHRSRVGGADRAGDRAGGDPPLGGGRAFERPEDVAQRDCLA